MLITVWDNLYFKFDEIKDSGKQKALNLSAEINFEEMFLTH